MNTSTGVKKEFFDEKQKTWIDLDRVSSRVKFLAGNKRIRSCKAITQDRNHLYFYSMDGALKNAITSGKYTVTGIRYIDEKNENYFLLPAAAARIQRILTFTV